jgi:hypothetical protein
LAQVHEMDQKREEMVCARPSLSPAPVRP